MVPADLNQLISSSQFTDDGGQHVKNFSPYWLPRPELTLQSSLFLSHGIQLVFQIFFHHPYDEENILCFYRMGYPSSVTALVLYQCMGNY